MEQRMSFWDLLEVGNSVVDYGSFRGPEMAIVEPEELPQWSYQFLRSIWIIFFVDQIK
jgi:hypothetical protein